MHILIFHSYFFPPGGYGNNRSYEFSRAFINKGAKVTLITSTACFPKNYFSENKNKYFLNIDGINVIALDVPYRHTMSFWQKVFSFIKFLRRAYREAIKAKNVDLVYALTTPLVIWWLGRKVARKKNIPYAFEIWDLWPDVPILMGFIHNPIVKNILRHYEKLIYQDAKCIVSLSDGITEKVINKNGHYHEKVITNLNGTNIKMFSPQEKNLSLKKELGFEEKDVVVLYAGTLGIANKVDDLVRVAELCEKNRNSSVRFLIIGNGNREDVSKKLAKEKNLYTVTFIDMLSKEDAMKYFYISDIGAVTFAHYPILADTNSATKFYDYLACGLPVCINYEGWQKKYLDEFRCGFSAPIGDLQKFYENIITLAENEPLRKEMSQNARKLAEEKFDREKLSNELFGVLNRIAG